MSDSPTSRARTTVRRLRRTLAPAARVARSRRAGRTVALVAVALVGVVLGLALGARTVTEVGPFHAELRLSPSASGATSVHIPPLGSLHFDSHDGPTQLTVQLGSLDQGRTQAMIDQPGGITRVSQSAADDIVDGVVRLGFAGMGASVLGAMILTALVFRNIRRVAVAGGLAFVVAAGSLGTTAATFRFDAVEEPRYEGLLVNAPALVGDVQRIADEWEQYADQLQRMIANVSRLYTTVSTLPVFQPDQELTRVMHVSDLHLNPNAWPVMRTVVEQYEVDMIIDTGDIVDWGTNQESAYAEEIGQMGIPYVYVRGNHDSEGVTQAAVDAQPNAVVLDNRVVTIDELTIAGIGDPRFTPDQRTDPHVEDGGLTRQRVVESGEELAATVVAHDGPVTIAAVHDPVAAGPLDGLAPYIVAGHRHQRQVGPVDRPVEGDDEEVASSESLLMVQGSTGGAGLRGLEGEHPEPLAMSVLYFTGEQRLAAYDDITVGGTGQSQVSLQRHLVDASAAGADPPGTLDGVPTPGGTRSPTPAPSPSGTP